MSEATKKKKVSKKSNQVNELTEDLKRIQADFVNYRRRAEEEKLSAVVLGKASIVQELIEVIDNLDRALAHSPEDLIDHDWVKGVASVSKQLNAKLNQLGLSKIATKDQEFNPELMEAVSAEGDGEHEVVAEELQSGYTFNGEVLRPAMVKVSRQ